MDGTGGLTRMNGGSTSSYPPLHSSSASASSSSSFPSTASNSGSGSLTPTSGLTTPGNRELRLRKIGGRSFNSDISNATSGTATPTHLSNTTSSNTNPYAGINSGPSSGTQTPRLPYNEGNHGGSLPHPGPPISSSSSTASTYDTLNNGLHPSTLLPSSSSPFVTKPSSSTASLPSTPSSSRLPSSSFVSPVKLSTSMQSFDSNPATPLPPSTPSSFVNPPPPSTPTATTSTTTTHNLTSQRPIPLPSQWRSGSNSQNNSQNHLQTLLNESTVSTASISSLNTTSSIVHAPYPSQYSRGASPSPNVGGETISSTTTTTTTNAHILSSPETSSYHGTTNSYSQRHSAMKNAYQTSSSSSSSSRHHSSSAASRHRHHDSDGDNNDDDNDENNHNNASYNNRDTSFDRRNKYKNDLYYETDTRTSNLSHTDSPSSSSSLSSSDVPHDGPPPRVHIFSKFIYSYHSKLVPFFILGCALFTRFYRLSQPGGVCFDESHFVRFTNQYTARTYFFDIHPPLGKLTLWFMGQLVGLNSPNPSTRPFMSLATDCNYEHISEDYADGCKYVYLRSVAAFHSSVTVLLMYLIARNWGATVWGGLLASGLLLFDMLNHIQGRLVLLDVQLSFWTMMALFCAQLWWKRLEEHWQAEEEIETVIELEEMRARLLDHGLNNAAQSLSASIHHHQKQQQVSSSSSDRSSDRSVPNGLTPQLSPLMGPASPTDNYATAYAFPLSKTSSTLSYLYNKFFSSKKKYDDSTTSSTENDSSWSYFIRNVLRKISVPDAKPSRSSSRTYVPSSMNKLSTKPSVSSSSSPSPSRGLLTETERNLWCLLMGFVCANAFSVKMTGLVTPFLIAIESFFAIWFIRKGVPLLDGIKIATVATLTYSFWFFLHFMILIRHGDGDEEFMTERFQSTLLESKYYDPNATWEGFWWTLYTLNRRMIVHNANILAPHPWMSSWYEWILNLRGVSYYGKDGQHSYTAAVYLIGNHAIHMGVILGIIGFGVAIGLYLRLRPAVAALVRKQILNFSNFYGGTYPSSSSGSATSNLLLKDGSAFNLWLASNTAAGSPASASSQSNDQLSNLRAFFCQGSFLLLGYILNLVPYLGVARSTFIYHYMPALLYGELLLSRVVEHWAGRHTPTAVKIVLVIVGSVWLHYTPWIYGFALTNDGHARRRWNPRWD